MLYDKIEDINKDLLIKIYLYEIETICINSKDLTKAIEYIRLFIKENEKKGTPFLYKTESSLSSNALIEFLINKPDLFQSRVMAIPGNVTVYELLIKIMIQENINIDLYKIIVNKEQLSFDHYPLIISELSLFTHRNTIIDLIAKNNLIHEEDRYYFDADYCLHQALKDLLLQLFINCGNSNNIPSKEFFAFIKDTYFKASLINTFKINNAVINYEELVAFFQSNTPTAHRLLHLLFGFEDADAQTPYLRNILKRNLITTRIQNNYKFKYKISLSFPTRL